MLEAILGRMVEHTLVTLVIFFALVLDNKVCQTGRSTEATPLSMQLGPPSIYNTNVPRCMQHKDPYPKKAIH